jgi:hypothetical protein
MFTTNLTHGRPYVFPHVESTARLFFNPEELKEYLPPVVLDWMNTHARPYTDATRSEESDPPVAEATLLGLKEIPAAKEFPVLLAARMSLSFPLLFAAVPLWAIDYEDPKGQRRFARCLFSDGGISSNFPVHLFDGLLPNWPTFGIELEPALPNLPDSPIFLPHSYGQGIADRWVRFDAQQKPASRLGGFVMSMIGAMQNWNDNTVSRMPGVRDRVVRIRLKDDEGGLNLNMDPDLITDIANRGRDAAKKLLQRFLGAPDPTEHHSPRPSPATAVLKSAAHTTGWRGWDFQRWVRLDVLARTIADKTPGLSRSLGPHPPHASSYDELLKLAQLHAPPGHALPLKPEETQALQKLITALNEVATVFDGHSPHYPNTPIPNPDLRVRPSL